MSGGTERELDALYLLARSHASFSSPDRILFLLSQLLNPCLPIHSSSDELAVLYCEENGAPLRGLTDFTAWSDVASLTKEAPAGDEWKPRVGSDAETPQRLRGLEVARLQVLDDEP